MVVKNIIRFYSNNMSRKLQVESENVVTDPRDSLKLLCSVDETPIFSVCRRNDQLEPCNSIKQLISTYTLYKAQFCEADMKRTVAYLPVSESYFKGGQLKIY